MWNWWSTESSPPPQVVLVPPLFDFPPLGARTRMLESSYDLLFGKMALKCLFNDYFEESRRFNSRIMLKPIDDPNVDLVASVAGFDRQLDEKIVANAQFRMQSADNPHSFIDISVSNMDPVLLLRSCSYYPKFGLGAFGIFPVLLKERVASGDFGIMGLRYGSSNLSAGATFAPFSAVDRLPKNAWLVSKIGRLMAGLQYEPRSEGSKEAQYEQYKNMDNWSCAICYGLGSSSPLSPSFNFSLEFAKNSQFIASFYQHIVVQRKIKNPLEEQDVVGITNYVDFGFELQTRIDDKISSKTPQDSSFQVGASWQANKNFLVKGKVGSLSSSIALAFKSWWNPSFTISVSAGRDHTNAKTSLGFSLHVDNIREASYQRADPNFVMLTPNKEHLAEGIHWKSGKRPLLQSELQSGNLDGIPMELKPLDKIL